MLIIIGAGGHGKVAADIAMKMGCYREICFLDDVIKGNVVGCPVIGDTSDFGKWIDEADYFVAVGYSIVREKIMTLLKECKVEIATLIHPSAVIGTHVQIACGTIVMASAVINPNTFIGKGCIINTACSVDHDNVINDYCHISVGTHLAGTVEIGSHTMVGAGATVINNVKICSGCMIGAGAVVVKDIEEQGTYVGVPAERH